jgi:large subunit ribosomal protein L1
MSHSKRYRASLEKVDPKKTYGIQEAVELLKSLPATKFDQTVNLVFKLGIDPKQNDQAIRGTIALPKGTGKKVRVVAFCQGLDIEAAKKAGAIEAGADELVAKVEKGWMEFDVAVAASELMGKVGKLGRVLGPKGLMPSPKGGTVTKEVAKTVAEFVGGKVEYRTDAGGNVAVPAGKLSFAVEDLVANIEALIKKIEASRPASTKGIFIEKVVVSSSMGPGIKLNVA